MRGPRHQDIMHLERVAPEMVGRPIMLAASGALEVNPDVEHASVMHRLLNTRGGRSVVSEIVDRVLRGPDDPSAPTLADIYAQQPEVFEL